jgi:hypothetical protein
MKTRRRQRAIRTRLVVAKGRTYVDSSLRQVLRRVERERADAQVADPAVPFETTRAAEILARGRAAGLLGRSRQAVFAFDAVPKAIEAALRATGARTIPELVLVVLIALALRRRRGSKAPDRSKRQDR